MDEITRSYFLKKSGKYSECLFLTSALFDQSQAVMNGEIEEKKD